MPRTRRGDAEGEPTRDAEVGETASSIVGRFAAGSSREERMRAMVQVLAGDEAITAAAAMSNLPAGFIGASLGETLPPAVTQRLVELGPETGAIETNLARAPIFRLSRGGSVQLSLELTEEWREVGPFYGRSFLVRGDVSNRDGFFLDKKMTDFVRLGCPTDKRVPFSFRSAARELGIDYGSNVRRQIKASLMRLRAVTCQSSVRLPGGREESLTYGLVERARTWQRGEEGAGFIQLSDDVASWLRSGSATLVHEPTAAALIGEDEIAWRLWRFLETHDLSKPWSYSLFAGLPGEAPRVRNMPALVDLLGITDRQRRRVARRLVAACAVIEAKDPRYRLRIVRSKERGMWRLEAVRSSRRALPKGGVNDGREPGYHAVARRGSTRSLGGVVRGRVSRSGEGGPIVSTIVSTIGGSPPERFSTRQRRVLNDIASEHGESGDPGWLERVLVDVGDADPFRVVLDAHRTWRDAGRPRPRARIPSVDEQIAAFQRDPLWQEGRYRPDELPPGVQDAYAEHLRTLSEDPQ